MKINGITVGTPTPRSNFNQTDPKKADFLVGRENIATKEESVLDLGTFWEYSFDGTDIDVTSIISYKPKMFDIFSSAPPFKTISLVRDGSGFSKMDAFYFVSQDWDYHGYPLDNIPPFVAMRFVQHNASSESKILTLTYYYDVDYETVIKITASLTTENPIGDIETALDGIIAIQEALIGGGNV